MSYKLRDTYYKKAKQQGYRSRAAYKLLELQERFRIFKTGQLVVDLGAAPGGWIQVAAKLVGPSGKVLGVDLQPIEALHQKNIIVIQGDITATETEQRIMEYLGRPADSVISDLAPKLTGIRDTDEARSLGIEPHSFGKSQSDCLEQAAAFSSRASSVKNFESFPRNWKSNLARFSVPGLMLAGKDHLKFIFSLRITGRRSTGPSTALTGTCLLLRKKDERQTQRKASAIHSRTGLMMCSARGLANSTSRPQPAYCSGCEFGSDETIHVGIKKRPSCRPMGDHRQ